MSEWIADCLAAGRAPVYSFEFFPPKDAEAEQVLWATIQQLAAVWPDFVSVTYGANGSNRERTIAITDKIATETMVPVMAHLTCVSQPVSQLREVLGAYADAGIQHVLAVRGDPPGGPTAPWQAHPEGLANATELVKLIVDRGGFGVGVAAFCDPHPDNSDAELDARILVDKADAGASFAVTQLFFDADAYFRLVERVRALGCEIPIIPGIMPVTTIRQIARFAELCGAELPTAVTDRLMAVADNPDAVRAVGVDVGTELSQRLLDGGAPGLHFFTQNRSRATLQIYQRLRGGQRPTG